ncbi:hypothetical protein GHK92_15045 [Nocardioides sp. dk4132]|uniref:hypothetical protein n=1 Tax=unclassified Nocardioides TaxID=2615069 RepID=UPI0012972D51|nr:MULTISPECIES: hypothetical protein [unclassified Nocardioides]MQW77188.1 hypothetical protein [Nocardioides sp. dk4132]QGA07953.1 hypothetical protein GFH29_11525 [Nocardioides sp. dk884]
MNQLTVRSAIAGIALATAAASLASVQSASASDDADPTAKEKEQSAPYDSGVPEGMTAEQLQLNDQMAAAVGEIRAIGDDLYYVSPDPATKVLTVAWKRPVPTKISALDSTTINGFTVDVVPTSSLKTMSSRQAAPFFSSPAQEPSPRSPRSPA